MVEGGITVALVSAGIICLIAAVIGGGLKGLGFDMPALQSLPRQMLLGGLGVVLLGAGLVLRGSDAPAQPKAKAAEATPSPTPTARPIEDAAPAPSAAGAVRTGPEWREAQTLLRKLGYYSGPIDGVAGPLAFDAVRRFQRDSAIPIDGMPGAKTLALLRARAAATR
jgi:hypothetical protein